MSLTARLLIIFGFFLFVILEVRFLTFAIKFGRKRAVLSKIKTGIWAGSIDFEGRAPAILYGKAIEIAVRQESVYIISDGKLFFIERDDIVSIKYKKGKYVFKLDDIQILKNTKVFSVKCDDPFLDRLFNVEAVGEKYVPTSGFFYQERYEINKAKKKKLVKKILISVGVTVASICLISSIVLCAIAFSGPSAREVELQLKGLTFKYHDDQGSFYFSSDVDTYIRFYGGNRLFHKVTGYREWRKSSSYPDGKYLEIDEEEYYEYSVNKSFNKYEVTFDGRTHEIVMKDSKIIAIESESCRYDLYNGEPRDNTNKPNSGGTSGNSSSRCSHASCKENGPFYCMGKNNTCTNRT